jgi:hypothetical protein
MAEHKWPVQNRGGTIDSRWSCRVEREVSLATFEQRIVPSREAVQGRKGKNVYGHAIRTNREKCGRALVHTPTAN